MTFFTESAPREPLLGKTVHAFLSRIAGRALGAAFLALSVVLAVVLYTWSPDDPSFLNIVDRAPQNALGAFGANLAGLLMPAIGLAAWVLPISLLVWGARLVLRRGEERLFLRFLLLPFALLVTAVFAAAHVPFVSWLPDYGLGGRAGDGLAGWLLGLLPMAPGTGVRAIAFVGIVAFVLINALMLGVSRAEARLVLRGFARGLRRVWVVALAMLAWLWSKRGSVVPARRARADDAEPAAPVSRVRREPGFDAGTADPAPAQSFGADDGVAEIDHDADEEEAPASSPMRLMERINAAMARDAEPQTASDADLLDEEDQPEAVTTYSAPDAARTEPVFKPVVQHPPSRPVAKSQRAQAEEQPRFKLDDEEDGYELPPLSLLESPQGLVRHQLSEEALEQNARMLESVLDDYGIRGEIVSVRPGPVVTMYELEPAPGLKASRVIGLADDIARSMSALAARVSTVPGRSIIGIELPNENREKVLLREMLSARAYGDSNHKLPLALGKDIGGEPVIANLAKMPHLLIAGTTGSGKSVAINTMILSLLYRLTPDECRLIMIDPKMLELSVYDGIPHLLSPVVTDPKKAVVALKWTVAEMEERYRKMSKMGVRNIDGYNSRVEDALSKGENFSRTVQTGFDEDTGEPIFETEEFAPEKMPFIVVIVDEMADLMMVAGKEIEACIQRLAQMARASGIHLIMATQRPSVDVITGTIKANFPTRISFQVTSKIDSRTILGEMGAEQLLGMGDMLYMAGGGRVTRVHGPFCSDEEVEEVVNHLKALGAPEYVSGVVEGPDDGAEADIDLVLGLGGNTGGEDALYDQAVAIVARDRKCSTSYIQRKLAIGYNKAARLVEQMEDNGVVSQANKVGKRDILVPEPVSHG
ncbi:FtsK/SpoIIIE family DNA translocase [Pontivivens insulae]|uniref:DNA translocase FtsK n=1 Tax=Pontivivens insulae TaxID=1639689 RepID=A0A2R8AEF6_9RHOB|nr:DNA translocase FtsK 4TM domain-containing protein [Pontivivens insulae]RED11825.1 S-DNA-T family DNA segregation ATPase FtsK/SpoIIIE [Pontivivens insulae]SPF30582.1 DNA translocase FtsK [Pontivivens insulae]